MDERMEQAIKEGERARFERFAAYDWAGDEAFQEGVEAIQAECGEDDGEQMVAQAQAFYYSQTVEPISLDEYLRWRRRRKEEEEGKEAYPASFSHIVGLISNGQPIPGIRQIPPTLLDTASQSQQAPRTKPWHSPTPPVHR